jgi:CHAT domain-containing protein/tetratricopeptide (TPR) repeat protein
MFRFTSHRLLRLALAVGLQFFFIANHATLIPRAAAQTAAEEKSVREKLAAALVEAKDDAARDAMLAREKESLDKELVGALVRLSERLRLRGEFAPALTASLLARSVAARAGDAEGEGDALYAAGFVQRLRGDYAEAVESFLASAKIREGLGGAAKTSAALNQAGYVHYLRGEFGPALEFFRRSLALAEAAGDETRIADALLSIAGIQSDEGDYAGALGNYRKGAELSAAAGNNSVLARALNDAAIVHRKLGDYARALENYRRVLDIFEAQGDQGRVGVILNNIGAVQRLQGDYEQALEYYGRSLALRERQGSKAGVMASLNNLGELHLLKGDRDAALAHFQRSLKLNDELGDKQARAVILNNLGHVSRAQGDHERATDYYRQSLAIREASGDRDGVSLTLNSLGALQLARGDNAQAAQLAERSAQLARQIGSRDNLRAALTLEGAARSALGQSEQARRAFEEAIQVVESLRTNVVGHDARATYLAAVREPYDLYTDLLMRLHGQNPAAGHDRAAWQMSERSRARSLIESLGEVRADIRAGVDPKLLERERALQHQLNAKAERQTRLLAGKHTAEQAAAVEKETAALAAAYREVQAEIRRASPRYAALTQPQPLTLAEVQRQVLDRDTVLLQYALGEERSYLWALTPDALWSFELPKRTLIEAAARPVRDLLSDPARWATDEKVEAEYERAALTLSRVLLPEELLTRLGTKRVAVVADGVLQYLPFGALPVRGAEAGGSGTKFLIADHEVVRLPSASTLGVLRREPRPRARYMKTVAVFADPVFDAGDERVALAAAPGLSPQLARAARATGILREGGRGLARLPFSRREAQMILAAAPAGQGRAALDFGASRQLATSDELARYRFVHFATHGILNPEHPELSGVVLSLIDERGRQVDGFLRLNEIYNLRLPAEMVVLSACQTALGREVRGEGVLGLVRGFMYAGSPRVVASLWKVDDRATAELMRRFYEGLLKDGLRPAAALRRAKVSMLREPRWRAPFHWAAFELQGEWK